MTDNKIATYFLGLFLCMGVSACDDDTFDTSPSQTLTFSCDTLRLDTLFSTVPSSTKSFWAFNKSGDGIRCTSVRQERGNQSGFRVNVDGAYLGPAAGYAVSDIELRKKDSIRIFVEATLPQAYKQKPTLIEDNLVFTLANGKQQKVSLNAYAWDADLVRNLSVTSDTTISAVEKPMVVYGNIEISEGATLTLGAGTTLYFHGNSGINVHGRLLCEGTDDAPVTLRGDRLDHMFDYLPYDNVSGQWNGVHFFETSYGNRLQNTDIHSTYDGIVIDSSSVEKPTLTMAASIVHNCQGYGLTATNAVTDISNCQITNTLKDCLFINGGLTSINNTTLAQFYPFDSQRGAALRFASAPYPLLGLKCDNTIVTGYADDELFSESDPKSDNANVFEFNNCLLRTPKVETDDSVKFRNVVFEDLKDTVSFGRKNFVLVDGDRQRYDFRLGAKAAAIGMADKNTATPYDITGRKRDDEPDAGAYEYVKPEEEQ